MKRPRSDVVMRRFMAGEDIESMAWHDACRDMPFVTIPMRLRHAARLLVEYDAALRRAMVRSEKRRKNGR